MGFYFCHKSFHNDIVVSEKVYTFMLVTLGGTYSCPIVLLRPMSCFSGGIGSDCVSCSLLRLEIVIIVIVTVTVVVVVAVVVA